MVMVMNRKQEAFGVPSRLFEFTQHFLPTVFEIITNDLAKFKSQAWQ
jgi:hypothetical protein